MILVLLSGCKSAPDQSQAADTSVNVRVHAVEKIEYKIPVLTTGILGTTTQVKLSFKTGGLINKLLVKEGDAVKKNELLAVLDLSEIRAQVNQARIGYDKAQRDLTRASNLYRDSVATLEQYQNARSALELAKSRKLIAEFNLKHSSIKAPSDGKIQKILVESNEMIAPGHPAILFASTENDWVVRCALTDKDIVTLAIGDTGKVTMDAFPGKSFDATITELGSIADPLTGTYEAELRIQESLPEFRSGFFSRIELYPTDLSQSMVVPLEAVLDASDLLASVFVFQDGKAVKRRIHTGPLLGEMVVVTDGLTEGELVITDGSKYIREGEEVSLFDNSDNPEHPDSQEHPEP